MLDHDYLLKVLILCNQAHERNHVVTDVRKLELSVPFPEHKVISLYSVFICLKNCIFWSHPSDLFLWIYVFLYGAQSNLQMSWEKKHFVVELSVPNLFPQYSLGLVWAIYLCFLDCHVQPWVIPQYNNLRNKILVNSSMGG